MPQTRMYWEASPTTPEEALAWAAVEARRLYEGVISLGSSCGGGQDHLGPLVLAHTNLAMLLHRHVEAAGGGGSSGGGASGGASDGGGADDKTEAAISNATATAATTPGTAEHHFQSALQILSVAPPLAVDESVAPNVCYQYGRIIFEAATDHKDNATTALAKGEGTQSTACT